MVARRVEARRLVVHARIHDRGICTNADNGDGEIYHQACSPSAGVGCISYIFVEFQFVDVQTCFYAERELSGLCVAGTAGHEKRGERDFLNVEHIDKYMFAWILRPPESGGYRKHPTKLAKTTRFSKYLQIMSVKSAMFINFALQICYKWIGTGVSPPLEIQKSYQQDEYKRG